MEQTYNELLRTITNDYLTNDIDYDAIPAPHIVEEKLLSKTNDAIALYNLGPRDPNADPDAPQSVAYPSPRKGHDRYPKLRTLAPAQIASIIANLHEGCRIPTAGENTHKDYDVVAIYQKEGFDKGIYVTGEDDIRNIARSYNYTLSANDFNEILIALRDMVPRKLLCEDKDLIAVNNGIFDYKQKVLLPFSPDFVFTVKSRVNYVDMPENPIITMPDGEPWDVESWLNELSDDPEIVALLWEILSAIIRPHVNWNKSAWLYSTQGNNGKGTLCELMRNLCGSGSYASIPLESFGKEFLLEPLIRANAIIVDENDVGTYIDHAANLKAVITNDVISINRKHKTPIACKFHGFMVQCMNEFPRVKDRSGSFYRRQLFIPMDKSFEGIERTYIKNDYLARQEVLEYVLWKVLYDSNFYKLSEPAACTAVLEAYKEYNDPVRQFFMEVEELATWTLLPWGFLYDLYLRWFKKNVPSGKALGKSVFLMEMKQLADKSDTFIYTDSAVRSANRMEGPEMLIVEYNVEEWQNTAYKGPDLKKRAMPELKEFYRGLQRIGASDDPDEEEEQTDD
jgi:putative DNA primase/helicase